MIMNRPYLFLSGEFKVTMPAVFSTSNWEHTMSATRLLFDPNEGHVSTSARPFERLRGTITYADLDDRNLEISNYRTLLASKLPTWPDPRTLIRMIDRHSVIAECKVAGFVTHPIYQDQQVDPDKIDGMFSFEPIVLKMGNVHRGEGKFKFNDVDELLQFTRHPDSGLLINNFTIEPFIEGTSIRAFIVGDETFGIRVENDHSWIKNSPGAEVFEYKLPVDLIEHSRRVADHFGLALAGVDYIVNGEGFHLLEINWCPGIPSFDDTLNVSKQFFAERMKEVEALNA